ncbi:MAG: Rrf2 family transcriptional regulator [Clostridia bacterium]|nr:Rrf2 family transcriptional regulator [Clostridia bacterium]
MDTKFSVAVHVLILISESPSPINSDQMAESVGTNASYIRIILVLLKKTEIIDGHRGINGYSMTVAPEQLTLLQVYQAVMEDRNFICWIFTKTPLTSALLAVTFDQC